MKFAKTFVAMLLAVVVTLTMTGFAFAEGETIKIGLIGPLTGAAADYGNSAKYGAQIAIDEVNALGGVQLELNAQDDEHDQEKAINAYNELMDWNVQMIIGCVTTKPCEAVGTQAFEDRTFMLTPSASSTAVTEGKDNVFQLCFTDPAQGSASARYIADHQLATKVAVIYNNADVYSTGIYQTFEAEASELNLEIVSVTTFTDDTTDFSVQVNDAQQNGAELIFLPIYYTPASQILTYADSIDYKPIFFGVDGMDGILTSIEGFDTSLAEGVMLLTPFAADAQDEKTVSFVDKYTTEYGTVPSQFAADGYDCVYALYEAINNAGITPETSREEACDMLIEQFKSLEIEGLTGTMSWNESGEVTKTPTAVRIQDGAYVGADVNAEADSEPEASEESSDEEAEEASEEPADEESDGE